MFPTDTAAISDGTTTHIYSLQQMGSDKVESVRRETAAPIDQPATLSIKHRETGTGLKTEQQSMLRFDRVVEDAAGNQGFCSAQLTLRATTKIATITQVKAVITELVNFLAVAGYKDKFVGMEP